MKPQKQKSAVAYKAIQLLKIDLQEDDNFLLLQAVMEMVQQALQARLAKGSGMKGRVQ